MYMNRYIIHQEILKLRQLFFDNETDYQKLKELYLDVQKIYRQVYNKTKILSEWKSGKMYYYIKSEDYDKQGIFDICNDIYFSSTDEYINFLRGYQVDRLCDIIIRLNKVENGEGFEFGMFNTSTGKKFFITIYDKDLRERMKPPQSFIDEIDSILKELKS